jgi:hypothetical protein
MITDEELADWSVIAEGVSGRDLAGRLGAVVVKLIAEVRRLQAARDDWHARYKQASGYLEGPGRDIVDGLRARLDDLTRERNRALRERDDMKAVVDVAKEFIRNGGDGLRLELAGSLAALGVIADIDKVRT